MRVELLAPRRARIRKQDVDVVRALAYLRHQLLDLGELGAVGGDGDGFCSRAFVRQGVEGGASFVAGRGFAGCYVDFGTAGLEEPGGCGWLIGVVKERDERELGYVRIGSGVKR